MFCTKCGNQINGQVKFCPKCGQAVGTGNGGSQSFILTINRANQWFAINPAVKVVIDGSTEYKIDNGATLNIPVSAGTHNIAFSCSMRNKIININVADNITLNIKWNRITGSLEVV